MRRMLHALILSLCFTATLYLVLVRDGQTQALPPGASPSCDQQLEVTRTENISLRKQLAQTMYQAAFLEEQNMSFKKQADAQAAQGKAAEKK